MKSFILVIMLLSGALFVGSVLLMSPKGGLGIGIGGMSAGGEYGSKKSVESTLKKVSYISCGIFIVCAIAYPYL